jgi:cysteine desulfurase/selenocysteine lyase
MKQYGIPGTVRASFAFYNTRPEIDRLAEGLRRAAQMLA